MPAAAQRVQAVYLLLTLLSTLAASLIWGVNTLFLLDAGLTNTEAFAANAFFTMGQVMFEVPTGVLADVRGRRVSYLLGASTLLLATLLYLMMWRAHAPLFGWAIASILLGLGFTFFSGATEAWLVDALAFSGFDGKLDAVFAKGQMVAGVAMLVGSVAGGFVAQLTNLGVPYILRSILLGLTLVAAFFFMHDLGFTPQRGKGPIAEIRRVARASLDEGWRKPPIRWLMLSAPFTTGVGVYAFYALQPYLLELYGDKTAFGVAGLAAAIVAGTQILGGFAVRFFGRAFRRRTDVLLVGLVMSIACLAVIGRTTSFGIAIGALVVWGMAFSAVTPVRQAYLNGLIPSAQRATVLSFDNLMGSAGGVVAQPALGRAADAFGYPFSYVVSALLELIALPFLLLARRENTPSDAIESEPAENALGH
ncbi:MAG TPA: MFS transporter [Polyangiaceae bacterium]|nr:MFS transporter [Polyangiaceae bacterium]